MSTVHSPHTLSGYLEETDFGQPSVEVSLFVQFFHIQREQELIARCIFKNLWNIDYEGNEVWKVQLILTIA